MSAHLLHEVANPLTAAALHLELLDDKHSRAIRQVRKNIQQLERYVEAVRKQLKAQSQTKHFLVQREVNHSLAVMAPIAQRSRVRLDVAPVPLGLKLFGDPVKFSQIFANVVVNAIDAYAELGVALDTHTVKVCFNTQKRYLVVTVSDWARGISPAEMDKLFEPFYTTKSESPRGLGIGLSLVKQTVEHDFKGSIQVRSSPQRGTTFTIKLRLQCTQPSVKQLTPPLINATSSPHSALQPVI